MQKLGQIFYGRGRNGYGVLGASPMGHPFTESVAALCRAVGSPDHPDDIRPFLLNKREDGNAIMIRACRGEGDQTGRSTLFFHALVAPASMLAAAKLDAFALVEGGAFLSALPEKVEDIEIPPSGEHGNMTPSGELRFPAFIASDYPLEDEVRRALGREALSRNWATYSYRPLDGFDLCVYSSYATPPEFGSRYAFKSGKLVAAEKLTVVSTEQTMTKNAASSMALKVSITANILLALLVILHWLPASRIPEPSNPLPGPTENAKPDSAEMTEAAARTKWETAWKEEWRRSLRTSFEKRLDGKQRINNFATEASSKIPYVKQIIALPEMDERRLFFDACGVYVDFIENELFNNSSSN